MDLERERGITIKAKSIRLHYKAKDGKTYRLNLIDTPGHVDFSYEVSRALSACEGALLVVDASQGVEAQTVANTFLRRRHNLTILPVINKIDLPAAQPDVRERADRERAGDSRGRCAADQRQERAGRAKMFWKRSSRAFRRRKASAEHPLQALIFDSWFDIYRGAVVLVRVMEGRITPRTKIRLVCRQRSLRSRKAGRAYAQAGRAGRTGGRRRGLHRRQHQARGRRAHGRHGHRSRRARAAAARL